MRIAEGQQTGLASLALRAEVDDTYEALEKIERAAASTAKTADTRQRRAGATSLREIAEALNARGIATRAEANGMRSRSPNVLARSCGSS
jgi:hypothetical protein